MRLSLYTAAALALLGGCSVPRSPGTGCAPPLNQPVLVFDLFFGRSVTGRGDVSDTEWDDFMARVVSTELPHGFTVFDARGAWMNPRTHQTVHEATKVLRVALPDETASQDAIGHVRAAYQQQFHQQLVGMTVQHACGSF